MFLNMCLVLQCTNLLLLGEHPWHVGLVREIEELPQTSSESWQLLPTTLKESLTGFLRFGGNENKQESI